MKLLIVLVVFFLAYDGLSNNPFAPSYQNGGVNGILGIVIADVREHTTRGVVNSVDFHRVPTLSGDMRLIPSEVAVLTYHTDWFHAHADDDPLKPVNTAFLKQNAFWYVKGNPRVEVLIQFGTGQLAVIKRSQQRNAPAGNVIGLGSYRSVVGLGSQIIQNRLGNPVQTRQLEGGGAEWLYYEQISQRSSRTLTSNQSTIGVIGNDFVGLETTSSTFITVERPLVLWNFVVSFEKGPGEDLRATGLTGGQIGPGEWKVVPAP
jgi:hypothetical protein